MNKQDKEVIELLQRKFSVKTTHTGNEIILAFEGIPDSFSLSTANDEYTLFAQEWHEHFKNIEQLSEFFTDLFSGRIRIVVKFRGKAPVSHQRQVMKDGKPVTTSWTGTLFSPFWRPKSFKTIKYEGCQHAAARNALTTSHVWLSSASRRPTKARL